MIFAGVFTIGIEGGMTGPIVAAEAVTAAA
jgi:hypothetical protein